MSTYRETAGSKDRRRRRIPYLNVSRQELPRGKQGTKETFSH